MRGTHLLGAGGTQERRQPLGARTPVLQPQGSELCPRPGGAGSGPSPEAAERSPPSRQLGFTAETWSRRARPACLDFPAQNRDGINARVCCVEPLNSQ